MGSWYILPAHLEDMALLEGNVISLSGDQPTHHLLTDLTPKRKGSRFWTL